ncbi:MAG: spore coat associated protein CotJA [Clostridia bacterium]|nr:spore coat associated protein CotJA [Clostridia bacterium]
MGGTAGQLPLPLAMAYVPPQKWTIVYDNEEALRAGTLFPALHLPFERGNRP